MFPLTQVNLLAFKINILERGSTVSFGPTQQLDTFITTKQNQGIENNGDFCPPYVPLSSILDTDVSDSNSSKVSVI
ncbi:hypothetical protein [Ammoniphilus sp. CFH 90114]|uniref:hypothetical protein n=1 Tax=Ammoniphilus sp. CFH 90114 TaxID=2493665 RepID=UPI00100EC8A5|nr:hypothetical protein [Ammoniphilus sp. CFH 90114]RXT04829.1 hypothetical protein EIZ39_19065 [Ammoniphilus sp. CFH 90114]